MVRLRSRAVVALRNPHHAITVVTQKIAEFATRQYEAFLAYLLKKSLAPGAVWRTLVVSKDWMPQPAQAVASEILRRVRLIHDPDGGNRYLPHRWRIIFNEIRTLTAMDIDWTSGPVFLSFGAGDRNPMGLPFLAVLAGASKGIALEPGPLRDELTTATLQETLWDLVRDPQAYGLTAADLGRLRTALNADALWRGDPLPIVLSKGCLELSRSTGEKSSFASGSIDIIYSRSVLEHVIEIEMAMAELVRALKPGGVMFHHIGLDAHDSRDPISFYYAERGSAANFYSGLNFWRMSDYVHLFERLGCVVEVVNTETVPQARIDRSRLIPYFVGYSDEDLRTIVAKMLVRKPR